LSRSWASAISNTAIDHDVGVVGRREKGAATAPAAVMSQRPEHRFEARTFAAGAREGSRRGRNGTPMQATLHADLQGFYVETL
jgi:hypothetical protein